MNDTDLKLDATKSTLLVDGFYDSTIRFQGRSPALKVEGDGQFTLSFECRDSELFIELDEDSMRQLNLALEISASHAANPPVRWQTQRLMVLEDRCLQVLIRNLERSALVDWLWYLNDAHLIRKVVACCSNHAGEALINDLCDRWMGIPPERASREQQERGRQALTAVMATFRRLALEGQIDFPMDAL